MARLTPLWTASATEDPEAIRAFLSERGIAFETWDLPDEVVALAAQDALTDEEKATLLGHFRDHLDRLAEEEGYVEADVVAVRPVDGVDQALAKFDRVHYHDDDEVRAIVGGAGVFGFVGDDGRQFLVRVEAGEYISVPAGMWHWFYVLEDRNITALRLFRDTAGWVPHYWSP
ncbi:MAG: cupin domain-containing protein [Myxococcota bacterium]